MKTITLEEYRRIVEESQVEESTWNKQEYLSETIYTTPQGRCLWESSNWWLDSEEIAKEEIRNHVWQVWVANIWSLRNILQMYIKKGGPTEEDEQFGWTIENIEGKIKNNFTMLFSVFGMTAAEIENGINDHIAYKKSFETLPSGSKERSDAIHNNKIILPEKGHAYAKLHPLQA
jgi:hypothetical protein